MTDLQTQNGSGRRLGGIQKETIMGSASQLEKGEPADDGGTDAETF